MSAPMESPGASAPKSENQSLEERLERSEVVYFPKSPFPLPEGDDRKFLLQQQLASRAHKNISYDPGTGRVGAFRRQPGQANQGERFRAILAAFAESATGWAAAAMPHYAGKWKRDRVSFRPEEEATRKLRLTARNDLLHVDAFPSRPTNGCRILRVFANINLTEPRIWVTSDPFPKLLERYGQEVGLPSPQGPGLMQRLTDKVLGLFSPGRRRRSVYDSFMLRFHNFLKANDEFQERGAKKFWTFPPGCAWVAITDTVSHAVLRGRYALEHSYFVAPESLVRLDLSPPTLLEKACGTPVLRKAA